MPRSLYTLLLFVALPFVPIKLWWRGIKQPAYRAHWRERFGFYTAPITKSVIWLHCVSLGETRAAEPIIRALLSQYPHHQIVLTHATPTGREASAQLYGQTVVSVYVPYDLPFAVRGFLAHFKPAIGLLMETELWFNLIARCKTQHVPLLLLNARLSEKSARGYAKLARLVREGLDSLDGIAAQTEADAKRLIQLGAHNVQVTGNVKFDLQIPPDSTDKGLALRTLMGNPPCVFLAASTRDGEEALILEAIQGLGLLTIIVPRHPQRFDEVARLLEKNHLAYMRRSALVSGQQPLNQMPTVILGDSMGELLSYYAACDFTFVGGSLLNFGGQNLIEPASLGKPVLIGPYTYNFAAAAQQALDAGAALLVNHATDLRQKIQQLQHDMAQRERMHVAALAFSQASQGATVRVMQLINALFKSN